VVYTSTPQILALGLKFPLTIFVRDLQRYIKVAPSQLVAGGWHVVLGLEALCDLFTPDSREVEDFSALYVMRNTKENGHFFATRSGLKKLIVNLADID